MRLGSLMTLLLGCFLLECHNVLADEPPQSGDPMVAGLIKQWKEGDATTRLKALRRLARIGYRSRAVAPELLSGLTDPLPDIRAATAEALGRIGAGNANSALIAALRDPELAVRTAATAALAHTRPDPLKAIPALAVAVRADPGGIGDAAVETLASIGRPSVPLAIDLFRDANPKLSAIGAQLLTRLGPTARTAVPILLDTLHGLERSMRNMPHGYLRRLADRRSSL